MDSQSIRGRLAAGIGVLTALGLLPMAAGSAAGGGISVAPTVGEAVSQALVAATGSAAIVDNSVDCISNSPQPVAYRTDRVVLSTSMSSPNAAETVRSSLDEIGVPSVITGVEIISTNDLPGAAAVVPVVSVSFRPRSGGPVPITVLTRHLRRVKGVPASPDYLLSPSSGPSEFWPNGGPKPAFVPAPRRSPAIGAGQTIFVYDTGLLSELDGNIPPNTTKLTPADSEDPDTEVPFGVVDLGSAGHTTAIAGVIATVAPGVAIKAIRITDPNGVATDVTSARRMAETLRAANSTGSWPDVIVNAFGSPACDGGSGLPGVEMVPLGLSMVAETVDRNSNHSLMVASAGNRSSSRRFYPAAFATVVGVGGLDARGSDGSAWASPSRSGPRAAFSNYGAWVKAWMPAVGLVTTHVKGYRFDVGGPVINGLASVDGTSFAAPMAAALIAEKMTASGLSAEVAWQAILASGVRCSPAVGSGVAVVLTTLYSSATTGPAAGPVEC